MSLVNGQISSNVRFGVILSDQGKISLVVKTLHSVKDILIVLVFSSLVHCRKSRHWLITIVPRTYEVIYMITVSNTLDGWFSHLWLIEQLKVTGTRRTSREAVQMFGTGAKASIPCAPLPDTVQWPSCPDLLTLPKVARTPGFPGSIQSQCLWEGEEQRDVNMWTQREVPTTHKVTKEVWDTEGGWTGHQEQHRAATEGS